MLVGDDELRLGFEEDSQSEDAHAAGTRLFAGGVDHDVALPGQLVGVLLVFRIGFVAAHEYCFFAHSGTSSTFP